VVTGGGGEGITDAERNVLRKKVGGDEREDGDPDVELEPVAFVKVRVVLKEGGHAGGQAGRNKERKAVRAGPKIRRERTGRKTGGWDERQAGGTEKGGQEGGQEGRTTARHKGKKRRGGGGEEEEKRTDSRRVNGDGGRRWV
jgi:hypothetical protein